MGVAVGVSEGIGVAVSVGSGVAVKVGVSVADGCGEAVAVAAGKVGGAPVEGAGVVAAGRGAREPQPVRNRVIRTRQKNHLLFVILMPDYNLK